MISSVRAFPAFATPVFDSTAPAAKTPAAGKAPVANGKPPATNGKAPATNAKPPASSNKRFFFGTKIKGRELSYETKVVSDEPGKRPFIQLTITTPGGTLVLRSDQPFKGYDAAKWADMFSRVLARNVPPKDTTRLYGPLAEDAPWVKSGEADEKEMIDFANKLFKELLKP